MMIFDAPFGPDKEAENMADQYSCKPLEGNYVAYSPGVCPEGHWIAEMTQHQVVSTGTVVSRHWQGSCCPRYISSLS